MKKIDVTRKEKVNAQTTPVVEQRKEIPFDCFMKFVFECLKKQESGQLISLNEIYERYERPKYKSPRRIMAYGSSKNLIEYTIQQNDMQVEKVIQYKDDDVYVNFYLALRYLDYLDVKNSFKLLFHTDVFSIIPNLSL